MVLDSQLGAEFAEMSIVELLFAVGDEHPWYPKSTNYGLPNKVAYVVFGYFRQCFDLNPLCEIIDRHDEELPLSHSHGQWSHDVDSPLGKWPRSDNGRELFSWLPRDVGEPLTVIALLHMGYRVGLHRWPVVSCFN